MKNVGIIRSIDALGRMSIPISLRRSLDINVGDPLEVYMDNDCIIIHKYSEPACMFCGNRENLRQFKGKNICDTCAMEFSR